MANSTYNLKQVTSGLYSPSASNIISGAKKQNIPAYDPNTMDMSKAPTATHARPSTPVKKITTTNPMGGTTVSEYHAPTEGKNSGLLSQYQSQLSDAKKQLGEAQGAGYSGSQQIQKDASGNIIPQNSPTNPNNNNFPSYVGNIGGASNTAVNKGQEQIQNSTQGLMETQTKPQAATTDVQNTLKGISTEQTPAVIKAQQEYNQFSKASPMLLADVANNPNVAAEVSVGRGQALGQVLSGEQQALQGNVQNALADQSQQIQAANEAGGLANTAQGQGITAGTNVLNAGTTQQGQGITGLGNAASYAKPELAGIGSQTYYNPLNPGQTGGNVQLTGQAATDVNTLANSVLNSGMDYNSALSQLTGAYGGPVANQLLAKIKESRPDFNPTTQSASSQANAGLAGEYEQGNAKLRAAANIEPQIVQTLISHPDLNQTPISALTNLNQWFSGQTSKPEQQQLSTQVASYINALGLSPEQAAAIATQKGGTIGTLLSTIKNTVTAQNEAKNPANVNKSTTTSNNTSTGGTIKTSAGEVNNKWFD